ncbi:hypothetical protein LB518_20855 [Mesorhizobium sp. BR1-1-16]|uniref:curli-like amyloid fiber formation chaperone CsgH n=1 Tax=Mesorhizobium sp. BR1-1-16 TaxID=2876653 RepID=UPI001CCCF36D|nr:curli-like amyloid fiber formation chaperone CsgH [Mesorhizobium sp. BR1-1-16]MBZ9938759.1 hypothetical protein [Mesorhizobium sp. BR1-1-16]
MTSMTGRIAIAAVMTLGAMAAGAAVAAAGRDGGGTAAGPLACSIGESRSGGQIILAPSVRAARATDGSYSLRVSGGGGGNSSTIRQGGDFSLPPGGTAALGTVSLSGGNATYAVTLDITAGAASARCTATIGG